MRGARAQWEPVWVVVDGSTDGSAETLAAHGGSRTLTCACCVRAKQSRQGRGGAARLRARA